MTPDLRIHLIAGFAYPAKNAFLRKLKGRIPICEPDRELPACDDDRVALVLPGHVEPAPLIGAWAHPEAATAWAGRPARLQSTTVVLDANHLGPDLASKDLLADRGWAATARDTRSVADLLFEQIEAADRIALGGEGATHSDLIRLLNPLAEVSDTRATVRALLTGRSTPGAWPKASWRRVRDGLRLPPEFPPALVYRRQRPFDQVRFQHWLIRGSPGITRAKGTIWLANNPDLIFGYSRAASVQRLFVLGRWPEVSEISAWDPKTPQRADLLARWDPQAGLRHQEFVLIGSDLDAERTEEALDRCLATEAELERGGRERAVRSTPAGRGVTTH